jgi:hypothetical protein
MYIDKISLVFMVLYNFRVHSLAVMSSDMMYVDDASYYGLSHRYLSFKI